jgi:GxxExxY protein
VERFTNEHMAQCLNFLRASKRSVCLLVNFQKPRADWRRIVDQWQPEPSEINL